VAIRDVGDVAAALDQVHGHGTLIPHRLFEIYPAPASRSWESCLVRPVSEWAFDQLLTEMESQDERAAFKLYQQIQGTTDAAAFCGKIWERQVHKFFRSIQKPTPFRIFSLVDRDHYLDIEFSSDTSHHAFGPNQEFGGLLASSVKDQKSCYLKPLNQNFATFDSFLYQHGFNHGHNDFQPLLGFQITDASDHPISLSGLTTTQTACRLAIPELKALRPSAQHKWIVVFVVPASMEAAFRVQNIKPESKHWESKIAQYVMGLERKQVWPEAR
jgi:hypothetical protein